MKNKQIIVAGVALIALEVANWVYDMTLIDKYHKKIEALAKERDYLKKKIFDFQNGFEQFYTKEIPDEIGAEDVLDNVKTLGEDAFGGWCGNTDFILDFGKEVENEIRLDFEIDD